MKNLNLEIAEPRILVLNDEKPFEEMKELAWNKKTAAFGGLQNLLSRPKPEDIKIIHSEKQYKPFWHAVCSTNFEYKRCREFTIKISDPLVKKVIFSDGEREVDQGRNVKLSGIEYCVDSKTREIFIDAYAENEVNFSRYVTMPTRMISQTEELGAGDNIVVPAKVKAAYIVRKLLSEMIKPIDADEVLDETMSIETLDLYFRPIYAFEYSWIPKNKQTVLEFDGITGEYHSGKVLREKMAEIFTEETLFEIGGEVAGVIIPGANIPMKILQESRRRKKANV
ncbi:MAG: hypothetical protein Q8J68_13725 [Methanolobus sp.]|uniref:hypothetical protein n=1 Tax=Methanolobus sp. TaxID=1874737 RepID=UPI0027304224|nr:hypothetical protein [Methanolobus sp.]MDP2218332.1 hypothetical protein [Methanolobus sp.]